MKQLKLFSALLLAATLAVSCSKDDDDGYTTPPPPATPQATVVSASGNLTDALAQFRALLGDSLNTTPGKTSGRREINWEGVPPANNNNNTFSFDFFNDKATPGNVNRKRGLEYANTGILLRVDSTSYSEIDASYANEFKAFSGKRLFAHANGTANEVFFKVPGTNTDAFVRGFGAVFSDVDDANSTFLEFYSGNNSLGKFKAPARTDANGHSFLGVFFPNEKVTAVRIITGNGILAAGTKDVSAGGAKDLVVMDDFFYSEPLAQH